MTILYSLVESSDRQSTRLFKAIAIIHQLRRTPETLWLRLLGRGTVQQKAIQELQSLPQTNRWRGNVIRLVYNLLTILATRQNQEADRDDEVLIVTLTQLYEEAISYQVRFPQADMKICSEGGQMPALLEFFDMTGVGASCSLDF